LERLERKLEEKEGSGALEDLTAKLDIGGGESREEGGGTEKTT
jgi:hypothetical protein